MVTTSSASTALGGGGSGAIASGYEDVLRKAQSMVGEGDKALAQFRQETNASTEKRDADKARLDQERTRLDAMPPVMEKPTATPEYKPENPVKAWGSTAMMFAMLASALTRQPMNNALNAAASTLKAFKQRDLDAYNREYQKWQMETQNATRMFQYQQAAYSKSLAELDRREGMSEKVYSDSVRTSMAEISAHSKAFKDDQVALLVQNHDYDGLRSLLNERERLDRDLEKHAGQIDTQQAMHAAVMEQEKNNPNWSHMSAGEKYHTIASMDPKFDKAMGQEFMGYADRTVRAIQGSAIGKAYFVLSSSDATVNQARKDLQQHGTLNGAVSNALVDIYARAVGGGVARSFLVNNLKFKDSNFYFDGQRLLGKFDPQGGGMPKPQAEQLMGEIERLKKTSYENYHSQIASAAALAADAGGPEKAKFVWDRAGIPQSGATPPATPPAAPAAGKHYTPPPAAAVQDLRKSPNTKAQFDAVFGPGAADRALGKGGPASVQPGTFSAGG